MPKEATGENSDRNMWRVDHIADTGQPTGLGGREAKPAGTVGNRATPTARRAVPVVAGRIRLPSLDDSVIYSVAVSVEHPTLNGQPFISGLDCNVDGVHANRKERSNGLRGRCGKSHVTPPSESARARAARCRSDTQAHIVGRLSPSRTHSPVDSSRSHPRWNSIWGPHRATDRLENTSA